MMVSSITREIAKFCANIKYESFSDDVIMKAKLCLLDNFGGVLFSHGEESANILMKTILNYGGPPESTVIGYGHKGAAPWVALVNGAMGHITELDDTHRKTSSHPGDSVIAATLAIAEVLKTNGKEVLVALIAGYEGGLRIGETVMPSHYRKGWHPSGTTNTFGAAIAIGRLLGFDALRMQHCIGIAGAQVSGNFAHLSERAMTKDFNPGRAAMNGVLAGNLAQNGFKGPTDFIENRNGFCALYSEVSNPEISLEDLSGKFKILEVAHKPYMSCSHLYGSIEGTLKIMKENSLHEDQVDRVTARIFRTGARLVDDPDPFERGLHGARFSAQFNIALILREGEEAYRKIFDPAWVRQCLTSPQIKKTMEKINVIQDDELDQFFPNKCVTSVLLSTKDGKQYTKRIDFPYGEPENPIGMEGIIRKFRLLSGEKIGRDKQERVIETVLNLEKISEIRGLLQDLTSLQT